MQICYFLKRNYLFLPWDIYFVVADMTLCQKLGFQKQTIKLIKVVQSVPLRSVGWAFPWATNVRAQRITLFSFVPPPSQPCNFPHFVFLLNYASEFYRWRFWSGNVEMAPSLLNMFSLVLCVCKTRSIRFSYATQSLLFFCIHHFIFPFSSFLSSRVNISKYHLFHLINLTPSPVPCFPTLTTMYLFSIFKSHHFHQDISLFT